MNRQLTWAVVADGGTDRLLVPSIRWALRRLDPDVEILEPEFRKRHGGIEAFLRGYDSGVSLIFVHRDSENLTLDDRLREFDAVTRKEVVPVVPVRMSEAWILFDGAAIAKAAGSPSAHVRAPAPTTIEDVSDPKTRLDDLLFRAAGSPTGRRGRSFKRSLGQRRARVAENITDYGPLESVPAFRRFQDALAERYPYAP